MLNAGNSLSEHPAHANGADASGPEAPRPGGVRLEIVRDGVRALVDPLSAVVGFSSLLVEGGLDEEERARFAQRVHEAARELEQRMRHLEALTRDAVERGEQLLLF